MKGNAHIFKGLCAVVHVVGAVNVRSDTPDSLE